ncbi:hypothetical protein ACFQ2T_08965 [Methylophilus flavus]|uniref:Uncharacterized protein n=1 Tax=Methylophilus flavus TaxID=640084 RepID=A0ABW3P8W4_9PROT
MKQILSTILAMQISFSLQAASVFEGEWFTCLPELKGRHSPYSRTVIQKNAAGFDVFTESGDKDTFIGTAKLVKTNLVVSGCHYHIDNPVGNCNQLTAPIAFTLKPKDYDRKKVITMKSLRNSEPIHTLGVNIDALRDKCEKLLNFENIE